MRRLVISLLGLLIISHGSSLAQRCSDQNLECHLTRARNLQHAAGFGFVRDGAVKEEVLEVLASFDKAAAIAKSKEAYSKHADDVFWERANLLKGIADQLGKEDSQYAKRAEDAWHEYVVWFRTHREVIGAGRKTSLVHLAWTIKLRSGWEQALETLAEIIDGTGNQLYSIDLDDQWETLLFFCPDGIHVKETERDSLRKTVVCLTECRKAWKHFEKAKKEWLSEYEKADLKAWNDFHSDVVQIGKDLAACEQSTTQ